MITELYQGARKPNQPRKSRIPDSLRSDDNFRYLDKLDASERSRREETHPYGIGVDSEIGRLRKVVVHTPGREVELMTPKTASELLYNDIIDFKEVQRSHAQLKGVLALVADVLEVSECLADVMEIPEARAGLLLELSDSLKLPTLAQELAPLSAEGLARALIEGLSLKRNTLASYLSTRSFELVPLPNMYFMRDSSMVVGKRLISSAMASPVRATEALIMRAIYEFHPELRGEGVLLDACARGSEAGFSIEGGDLLVMNPDLYLVGISARTSAQAVDAFMDAMHSSRSFQGNDEPFNVICVLLPNERSTIHLDMIFTVVNHEQAIVSAPHILGRERARCVRVRVNGKGERKFTEVDDLLLGLRSVGVRIDPILCGGDDPLHQQREQWNSGANMFAFAPGKIISYAMHEHTVRACEAAGFRVAHARDVLQQPSLLEQRGPVVVTIDGLELARGGGGPRCMTCPVLRDAP